MQTESLDSAEAKQAFRTHEVSNQVPALGWYNAWQSDPALIGAVEREGGSWASDALNTFGSVAGGEIMELGYVANENPPKLRAFDRNGYRIDEVDFHPAYHRVMQLAMQHGVHAFAWRNENREGAHVARAALSYMHTQAEAGTSCPLTMTHSVVPALRQDSKIGDHWIAKVNALEYDPRVLPASDKTACTMGMGMTEKQGGSDVRSNTTEAVEQTDGSFRIVGHKWFFSAPMCDAWLVLANVDQQLSCFLMPKLRPDGSRNAIHIQRLKDKLGDRSNASSEVEFAGAYAQKLGEIGRGIHTILDMVALTRLDCMIGSSALMRQATVQALHHARHRRVFGKHLTEQALMQNVLADLVIESEAAVALTLRVARAVDAAKRSKREAAFARIATAIGKYWICKRAPAHINEAQECLGGLGFVEESNLPRLYRQAPLNSIWEGSGNIQCLDVLRAFSREPDTRDALFVELSTAKGMSEIFDREVRWLGQAFEDQTSLETRSRLLVERAALALQASLLLRTGNTQKAEIFCRTRLSSERGLAFGTLPADTPMRAFIDESFLHVA